MAAKTDLNASTANVALLHQPAQQDSRTRLEKLPAILHAHAAFWLEPRDILSASRSCKTLHANLSMDRVWKNCMLAQLGAPPACTNKAQFLAYQGNITQVTFTRKTIPFGTNCIERYSTAHRHKVSNCFLTMGTSCKDWNVFDLNGTLVCSVKIESTIKMRNALVELAYLTQDTILLVLNDYWEETRIAIIFSRTDGSFLRKFDLPEGGEAHDGFDVVTIYKDKNQQDRIVLFNEDLSTFCIYDFMGTKLKEQQIEGRLLYFSQETRSIFYLDDKTVHEHFLSGESRICCVASAIFRNQHRSPEIDHLEANAEIICATYTSGQIWIWDYATGRQLCTLTPGVNLSKERGAFHNISLFQDKVFVHFQPHFSRTGALDTSSDPSKILYDKHGKELLSFSQKDSYDHTKGDVLIFPVLNSCFVYRHKYSSEWVLCDKGGKILGRFQAQKPHADVMQLNSAPGQIAIPSETEIQILDFTPQTKT